MPDFEPIPAEAPMWRPSEERVATANLTRFMGFVNQRHGLSLSDYKTLHAWSVSELEAFWQAVWDFCRVIGESGGTVLEGTGFCSENPPGVRWFPNAQLNIAENLLRYRDDQPALVSLLETGRRRELTYGELYRKVTQLAASLKAEGVGPGDRVAGLLPNIPEAVIGMLACASLGATWSSCSPDFGVNGVLDRLGQIEPRVLLCADGYFYNGKTCDSLARVADVAVQIPSIQRVVIVPLVSERPQIDAIPNACLWMDYLDSWASELAFPRFSFDHPLYIMYSSGTTGLPKCIVHGAGGTLLQHLKEHQLQVDLRRSDVFFYFTTCGWMMWNWLVSGLATGATLVLFDGSPFARGGRVLLDAIDAEGISVFGASAKYFAALEKAGLAPAERYNMDRLRTILSTGSPLSHESYDFIYRTFKADLCLSSISGGTDILSCFVGGCPTLPVYRGEIQCPGLGMAVEMRNERGEPVRGEKGELVCTRPFPSAPVGFWNDPGKARYRDAYFSSWPDIWAHGDYGEITPSGGVIIHGRSDAVLNPGGVRIGTSEIYRQVEKLPEVMESIAIGQEWQGDVRIILFVVLAAGASLDAELEARIRQTIRDNTTPRHVPAKIVAVADIPRTLSGKIVEIAVREVVHGRPVKNVDALANPEALNLFTDLPQLRS
ncbi:MAG: acetoacetate--CoA ligase [Halieaceae bacterium]|jgi:acetoacetyl-CoA synthetase|nr:acetoacetate--CoA ligase [Halieaceae bacterium]